MFKLLSVRWYLVLSTLLSKRERLPICSFKSRYFSSTLQHRWFRDLFLIEFGSRSFSSFLSFIYSVPFGDFDNCFNIAGIRILFYKFFCCKIGRVKDWLNVSFSFTLLIDEFRLRRYYRSTLLKLILFKFKNLVFLSSGFSIFYGVIKLDLCLRFPFWGALYILLKSILDL